MLMMACAVGAQLGMWEGGVCPGEGTIIIMIHHPSISLSISLRL